MRRVIALLFPAILCVATAGASAAVEDDKPIRIASGLLLGVMNPDKSVTVYKGIPFAAPPTGDLRFRPPKPATPWPGVRKADRFGPSCMQGPNSEFLPWTKEFMYRGPVSEDCLYLNVWTPRRSSTAGLSVLVYIHGGAFRSGSGNVEIYDGEQLAKIGLVVVTINYRLGVFGFLAHPALSAESEQHSSGNYALLDQIAALQWVRQNIQAFGGDPSRVTIVGQSAGAFSVQALVASPLAKGLFRAAIAESGLGISALPMGELAAAEKAGKSFADSKGLSSVAELRSAPAEKLLDNATGGMLRFSPIVDGWVLPASPSALAERGVDNDVPIITGWQADDANSLSRPATSVAEFEHQARRTYGALTGEFLKLYPVRTTDQVRDAQSKAARDRERVSMYLWAVKRFKNHKGPLFTYYFDRAIPWPQHPEFQAFHSGELPYVFRNLKTLDRPYEPVDFEVSETISSYWKNFISDLNPSGRALPRWPSVDASKPSTMRIGERTEPIPLADEVKLEFWTRYFNSPESRNAPLF